MAKRPNFILFMTDQQRWDHLGCYGNQVLKTPNIDGIAERGVTFDKFYVASGVCMPNRATLMTGRMPSVHGVRFNGVPLHRDSVTFVDLLRASGYATALVGKGHLQNFTGLKAARDPSDAGGTEAPEALREARRHSISGPEYEREKQPSDERRGYLDLPKPYYGFEHVDLCTLHGDRVRGDYDLWLREHLDDAEAHRGKDNALPTPDYSAPQAWHTAIPTELYPSSYVADKTEEYLRKHVARDDESPFFLQCSFPDPHHPYTPPGDYFRLYDPEDMKVPASFHNPAPQPTTAYIHDQKLDGTLPHLRIMPFAPDERQAREIIALTYGMISLVDDCVGRVLRTLDELGIADDTVLLFTSDHGDFMGDHGIMLKGPLHYQGMVRVPFIWADPARAEKGERCDSLSGTVDIAQTVLGRAGLVPFNGMQGQDLQAAMDSPVGSGRKGMLIEQDAQRPNFHFDGPIRARTYVTERWRLSRYAGSTFAELYDLENDPHEMHNLWNEPDFQGVKAELLDLMLMKIVASQEQSPLPTDFA